MNPKNTLQEIETVLNQQFAPTLLQITDQSHLHQGHAGNTGGGHFTVEIAAASFADKSRIDIHREIYSSLETVMHRIHALKIVVRKI